MKKFKNIIMIILITLVLIPKISYATLYDITYPPNSSGKADYTDEEADEQANKASNTSSSEDYVGKSSNNYLKSLTVENAKMEPEFNRQYVDYTLTLENADIKKIKVLAEAEDENATIEGTGEIELEDGINNIRVVVRAENGNVQIYNFTVKLPFKQSDFKLTSLEIYGVNIENGKNEKENLSPKFDSNVYEYQLIVPNEIVGLYINSKSDEGSYVSNIGGETLEVGNNTVYIKVIDTKDESKITTYTINVERRKEKSENIYFFLIGVVTLIIIIILLIYKMKNKKHSKK